MPATGSTRPWYDRPLRVGAVAGVPVAVSTSWVLVTVFMVAIFAPQIRRTLPELGWVQAGAVALAYTLILALSVLLHEVAHALAARQVGWRDSSIEITLWGGHTSFEAHEESPGRSLYVSVVGPLVNLALGALGLVLQNAWDPHGVGGLLLYMAVWSNVAVGVFNLMPGLPLDGGRVVESVAWKITGSQAKGTIAAGWAGRVVVVAVLAAVVWALTRGGFEPGMLTFAALALVLLPLWSGAGRSIQHGRLRLTLESMQAAQLLRPVQLLAPGASVASAEAAGVLYGTVVLASAPDGGLLRVLPEAVLAVPDALRGGTPATQAGVPADDGAVVSPDADGDRLARAALESISGTVLVVDEQGRCVGAVRREDVVAAIQGRPRKEPQQ
ncbi:MAG: site-2 protease family protein [Arthrobacter sp.]|jgi:Zn-dependent protease/CBS domain-containing protein|nr:site-2 protease family protein [Arthrobacter sp.]